MMRDFKYILVNKKPVAEPDVFKWAEWFEQADRKVARTKIGKVTVSTVFLALKDWGADETPPLLFETMIFGGPLDGYQDRTSTWAEAEKAHQAALDLVKLGQKKTVKKPV